MHACRIPACTCAHTHARTCTCACAHALLRLLRQLCANLVLQEAGLTRVPRAGAAVEDHGHAGHGHERHAIYPCQGGDACAFSADRRHVHRGLLLQPRLARVAVLARIPLLAFAPLLRGHGHAAWLAAAASPVAASTVTPRLVLPHLLSRLTSVGILPGILWRDPASAAELVTCLDPGRLHVVRRDEVARAEAQEQSRAGEAWERGRHGYGGRWGMP
mmetsp:Transcript_41584/g.129366  ORF Transcript_41584/g.129366 Transcript_41584/m.129366 type:complete len:217 (-) Transcript_41584:22-672(-)